MKRKCTSCGSENFEPGKIQSTGRVYFRPKHTKFLNLKSADIEIEGNICTECGHIMLVGDKGKAKALVSGK
jgi:predicted nucleic-acid-binding Zn-ribbon protein